MLPFGEFVKSIVGPLWGVDWTKPWQQAFHFWNERVAGGRCDPVAWDHLSKNPTTSTFSSRKIPKLKQGFPTSHAATKSMLAQVPGHRAPWAWHLAVIHPLHGRDKLRATLKPSFPILGWADRAIENCSSRLLPFLFLLFLFLSAR